MGFEAELRRYLNAVQRSESVARTRERVDEYALELGLVRPEPATPIRLTALATAFLRLRGRAAIRWLLTAEVMQSTGRWDDWRVAGELLAEITRQGGVVAEVRRAGAQLFAFSKNTLARLIDFGVLTMVATRRHSDEVFYGFEASWRDDIDAVLADGPWHRAISAILDEAHAEVIATAAASSPMEAVAEQSKVITHEVRNALVPVRHHLDALRNVMPDEQLWRLDAAKRGVVRVLDYAEELVSTSELIAETALACDLAVVTREALSWLEDGQRVEVKFEVGVRLRVPKQQFTRAIMNVLRNALQATTSMQPVRVTRDVSLSPVLRLMVDDGGAGVPVEQRERVFQEGFTTRDEGSGYGLAYVRRVIADELRGKVWCEASDLGGARFVIELPETLREP